MDIKKLEERIKSILFKGRYSCSAVIFVDFRVIVTLAIADVIKELRIILANSLYEHVEKEIFIINI